MQATVSQLHLWCIIGFIADDSTTWLAKSFMGSEAGLVPLFINPLLEAIAMLHKQECSYSRQLFDFELTHL